MRGDRLVARIGLADKKIGIAPDFDQRIGPLRIAGIGDDLGFGFDPQTKTGTGAFVVHDAKRRDAHFANIVACTNFEFAKRDRKRPLRRLRAGESIFHECAVARFESRRADDGQAGLTLEHVIGFKDEERQSADMVGMKMRDQDRVDVVAVDRKLVHGNKRSGAAIDQRIDVPPHEMKAGIESSARPERIAATDELQLHENPQAAPAPAKANRTTLIAGDEPKSPLGVLRRTAIKSVTTVTNAAGGSFYDSYHKMLFSGAFQPQPAGI